MPYGDLWFVFKEKHDDPRLTQHLQAVAVFSHTCEDLVLYSSVISI